MESRNPDEELQLTMAQLVKRMKENMVASLEYEALRAKVGRHRFECLVQEGFTEEQALAIVKVTY